MTFPVARAADSRVNGAGAVLELDWASSLRGTTTVTRASTPA